MASKRFDLKWLIGAPGRASNITLLWCDYFKWHSINGIYMATSRSLVLAVGTLDISYDGEFLTNTGHILLDKNFQF